MSRCSVCYSGFDSSKEAKKTKRRFDPYFGQPAYQKTTVCFLSKNVNL